MRKERKREEVSYMAGTNPDAIVNTYRIFSAGTGVLSPDMDVEPVDKCGGNGEELTALIQEILALREQQVHTA